MFNLRLVISLLAATGLLFAALNLNQQPLFDNTESFVLFADQEITLEQETQISSGDLGSNGKINIQKDNIINGNLFAKEIIIDKDTTINGNASYNKLKLHKESLILGATTSPVTLPIAKLPFISNFSIGNQDFKFTGTSTANTLAPGNYRNIFVQKNSRLFLSGGAYNLRKLELKENSVLIFNSSTILNIQFKLKGDKKVSVLPGNNNLSATDLFIKYIGSRPKKDKEQEDDDNEIESDLDDQEKKDLKRGALSRPILFGRDSFLNFKLLAPNANVKFGERTTLRGQILSREIKIGKDSVLSKQDRFFKESESRKVVEDNGLTFIVNELVVLFDDSATQSDAQEIADLIGGRIAGFIQTPPIYKFEVPTNTAQELNDKIQAIKDSNNPLVVAVIQNLIGERP